MLKADGVYLTIKRISREPLPLGPWVGRNGGRGEEGCLRTYTQDIRTDRRTSVRDYTHDITGCGPAGMV